MINEPSNTAASSETSGSLTDPLTHNSPPTPNSPLPSADSSENSGPLTDSLIHNSPPTPNSELPTPNFYNGPRSKITALPKAVRDKLNSLLRDGFGHAEILASLGDDAKDITVRNLSDHSRSPSYQHWLLEQEWLENLHGQHEDACDLLAGLDVARFNEATLQLAVTRLFHALRHLEAGDLNGPLGGNARTFSALVHALARASRETTNIEKYRAACAQAVAAELKELNQDRELSDREYELLVKRMDRVFKVRRPTLSSSSLPPVPTPYEI